ncbi:LeuA family protein [Aestuariispira ectoiniformans]|uniref:LeuA family protein n=1 Tax=Aestuariispira ectoiniformans TaxID=2775080 RepID=UPI00223A6F26|nr:hypothetical protein [Aestuariispira ectoiniformans]
MNPEDLTLIHDWNPSGDFIPKRVAVLDDTIRDGLQSPSVRDPELQQKKQLVRLSSRIGSDGIVLGLPGASPKACDEIAELAIHLQSHGQAPDLVTGVRTHSHDIKAHLAACEKSGATLTAGMFLGSSPMRLFAEGWEWDDLVELTRNSVRSCVKNGAPVMFITEDSTRSRPEDLRDLYKAALDEGATRICLADTCGHAEPAGTRAIVRFALDLIKESGTGAKLDWHGHNDRGLAQANALAAADEGVDRIHATCLGIGERVGNTALDQLLVNLELKFPGTGRDLSALPEYCERVREWCDAPLPGNYPMMGNDAFRTATGVHAAAIVKALDMGSNWIADRVYSAVPASLFGRDQTIEIGFMSGRHNVLHWLKVNHPHMEELRRESCVERVLNTAKSSRTLLTEDQVARLVADEIRVGKEAAEGLMAESVR